MIRLVLLALLAPSFGLGAATPADAQDCYRNGTYTSCLHGDNYLACDTFGGTVAQCFGWKDGVTFTARRSAPNSDGESTMRAVTQHGERFTCITGGQTDICRWGD